MSRWHKNLTGRNYHSKGKTIVLNNTERPPTEYNVNNKLPLTIPVYDSKQPRNIQYVNNKPVHQSLYNILVHCIHENDPKSCIKEQYATMTEVHGRNVWFFNETVKKLLDKGVLKKTDVRLLASMYRIFASYHKDATIKAGLERIANEYYTPYFKGGTRRTRKTRKIRMQ